MKPARERADLPKAVGIWIRVSTDDQVRDDSPAVHEKRARLYAEAKGWEVREVYRLEGVSGKGVSAHPETKRMLSDARSGRITGLIFSKLARLARNAKELLEFSEEFRKCGADLISLHEAIDTSSSAGRLFYTIIAAMAQWEREEIAERVAASVPIRAKMGRSLGGKAPFGYKMEGGVLVINPAEAPVRKLVYELFIEHRRQLTVANILNQRGYRTSTGIKFTRQTVLRMLRDSTAKGIRRMNYSRAAENGTIKLKPEKDWVFREVPAIVSEAVWNEANALLDSQQSTRSNIGRRAVHLFSGFVHCHCGQKMYVPSRNPRYRCWKCDNRIPVADLETIYHEELKGYLFSDAQIAEHRARTDKLLTDRQLTVEHLEREIESVRREMDKTYKLYQEDQLTVAGFGARYRPLEGRLSALESELPTAQAALDVLRIHHISHDVVLSEARDLHLRWPKLSRNDKRAIVEAITKRITVGGDTVEIDLYYAPTGASPIPRSGENPSIPPSAYAASRNSAEKGTHGSA